MDENRQSTIRDQGCKIFSHLHAIRYTIGGHLPPLTCGSRFSSRAEMTMCCVLHTYSLIQPPPSFPYFFIPQSGPRPSRTASISEPPKPANANPLCVSERTYQLFSMVSRQLPENSLARLTAFTYSSLARFISSSSASSLFAYQNSSNLEHRHPKGHQKQNTHTTHLCLLRLWFWQRINQVVNLLCLHDQVPYKLLLVRLKHFWCIVLFRIPLFRDGYFG